MVQRLTLKTPVLLDVIKTLDVMYTPDKLYDYSNYVTLYGASGRLFFEMCVIMDGASNDAMVRLWEAVVGVEDFSPVILNFAELRNIIKAIKAPEVSLEFTDKSLVIQTSRSTHTMSTSTVSIPNMIRNRLGIQETGALLMRSFNLLKLYNQMDEIANNLTANTLQTKLYGIMNTPQYLVASDGYSMSIELDGHLNETFMFPKHSLRILKMLPKIGTMYAIQDHRIFISGSGFECYIGEWSGYKDYPIKVVDRFVEDTYTTVGTPNEVLSAIAECHQFAEIVKVDFANGTVSTGDGTHIATFPAEPQINGCLFVHKKVLQGTDGLNPSDLEMWVNVERKLGKLKSGSRIHIFLGVTKEDEDEDEED